MASRRFQLGRPARPRKPADRRRTHDPRLGAGFRAGQADAAGEIGLPRRALRPRHHDRAGRDGLSRRDDVRTIWRLRPRLRGLWPGGARGGTGRFRLPLGDERAELAGDAPDRGLWQRGAEAEIPAEAGHRRIGRLLRPDRARCGVRSRRHEDAGRQGPGRLCAQWLQDVDHQFADRRHGGGLGQD